MEQGNDIRVYSMMQEEEAFSSFKKTILGKVKVTVLNPFNEDQKADFILFGDPKTSEDAYIDVWNAKQHKFFLNANRQLLKSGVLLEIKRAPVKETVSEPFVTATDEEIIGILKKTSGAFKKDLSRVTSEAVAYRFLTLANQEERPASYIEMIKSKLSELQGFVSEV